MLVARTTRSSAPRSRFARSALALGGSASGNAATPWTSAIARASPSGAARPRRDARRRRARRGQRAGAGSGGTTRTARPGRLRSPTESRTLTGGQRRSPDGYARRCRTSCCLPRRGGRRQVLVARTCATGRDPWSTSRSRGPSPSAASWCCASAATRTPRRSLELRANGVFVMDTAETTHRARARRRRARSWSSAPRRGAGRRAGPRLHAARGARRPPGRAAARRRDRAGAGRLDARRHHPPRAAAARRRAGQRRGRRRRGWRSRRPARRRTTWCCSTSTTAPATSCTRPTPRSTRSRSSQAAPTAATAAGALVIWSAAQAPQLGGRVATGLRRRRRRTPTTSALQERDERYWLYVGRREP